VRVLVAVDREAAAAVTRSCRHLAELGEDLDLIGSSVELIIASLNRATSGFAGFGADELVLIERAERARRRLIDALQN
jgi:hypothetical protein